MTVAELYECDPTLRSLIDLWVSERRCPMPLVDRLLELDCPSAADCALWAASMPERMRWAEEGDATVYPTHNSLLAYYFWYTGKAIHFADHIPEAGRDVSGRLYPSVVAAVIDLLERWRPEAQMETTESNVSTNSAKPNLRT